MPQLAWLRQPREDKKGSNKKYQGSYKLLYPLPRKSTSSKPTIMKKPKVSAYLEKIAGEKVKDITH
jgi:hypothetical protein